MVPEADDQTNQTQSLSVQKFPMLPNLTAEFSQIKRPKPSVSLASSGGGLILGLVWTLFCLLTLVDILGNFLHQDFIYNLLLTEGVPAQAMITQLEVDNSSDASYYRVYYRFTGKVNEVSTYFEGSDNISPTLYNSIKVGEPIGILYAASDPAQSAIKADFGPPDILFTLIFGGLSGILVLIGLGMLYGGFQARRNLKLLRSVGIQTQAILFDRWQDKDSDGTPTYFVAFAFNASSPQGGQLTIAHAEQNKTLYDYYRLGATLTICYLASNPSICQIRQNVGA